MFVRCNKNGGFLESWLRRTKPVSLGYGDTKSILHLYHASELVSPLSQVIEMSIQSSVGVGTINVPVVSAIVKHETIKWVC